MLSIESQVLGFTITMLSVEAVGKVTNLAPVREDSAIKQ